MIYVLARQDVEGIQELLWAGDSAFEAESKFKEAVETASEWRKRYKLLESERVWKQNDIRMFLVREFGEGVELNIASELAHYVVYGFESEDKRVCFVEE